MLVRSFVAAVLYSAAVTTASPSLLDLFARADGDRCTNSPANPPPPPKTICGLKGALSSPAQIGSVNRPGSVESCVSRCRSTSSCISFSYNSNGACRLYSKRVIDQGFRQDSTSTTQFWKLTCWKCSCGSGETNCGGTCYDLQSNAGHCGQCSLACPANSLCLSGSCTCNPECSGGQTCNLGTCECPSDDPDLCSGQCTNVNGGDTNNCGTCGNVCVPYSDCVSQGGSGVCKCQPGRDLCDGPSPACVDFQTDSNNCGDCGIQCRSDQVCNQGTCGCATGRQECNGVCTDITSDPNNCNGCGNQCGTNEHCNSSQCECRDPYFNCVKVCNGRCTDICNENNNCAVCGGTCPANTHCYFAGCVNN